MKARFFAIAAMVLSLASCQRDQAGLDSVVAGEQDVNITVALPEVTRATNSEVGALGNIDLTKYDIRYILEVYEGEELAKERFVNYENDATSTNFSMRLIPGRDYRFVVWADFVKEGTQVDLHYNTANLKSVEAINFAAIDESRDAYTAICNVEKFSSAKGIPAIELKRPFGKLRVQTTDVNQMTTLRPVGVTVTYVDTKFAHKFNAFASEVIADYVEVSPVTVDLTADACKYTNEDPEANGLQTLYADYFFATESGDVKFEFDVELNDGTKVPTLSFNTYIPVMRNVLTTVRGNVLTDGASIEVFINDAFENNTNCHMVSTPETLAQALTANEELINVTLVDDIDLPISSLGAQTPGSGEYKLGGEATETININLNGHKLNITTTYWSAIGAKNENALFTIKNGTMTSSQPTGTWNSYDLTFANCNYVFEDVVFDKAIALSNVGEAVTRAEATIARKSVTMKNVTINETHDYYAMWITAEGQTVNVENLTINSLGRGIKIDEQYVDAPAKVTLNINGADFNTKKKAAIMVKSVAGAEINLSNVDIAGAYDKANAVWVDEDSKAYADKVTVTGGSMAIEGENVVEAGASDFANVISNVEDGATIVLAAGNYTMPATGGKDIAIVGGEDTVINLGATNTGSSYVTLYGVTIKAGQYKGFQHSGVVTYNNVTIEGELFCYGEKDIFNNCTFELNNRYVWTYGSKEVVFEGCTFNTNGKAILVYNEGAGATKVTVNNCTFNATAKAYAGAIKNQNCAAIEIDNFQSSGVGVAHNITTSNNTVGENFSGEWRLKNYVAGAAVTVNGTEYTQIAIDGKKMTIDADKNVTVL